MTNVTRDDIEDALAPILFNYMNYPEGSRILGKDVSTLRDKCVDAVWDAVRPKPVEWLASELEKEARGAIESTVCLMATTFGVRGLAVDVDGIVNGIDWRQVARNHIGDDDD